MDHIVWVLIVCLLGLWKVFVLTKLWAWFIVPIFHLPILTLAPMYGIMLTVGMFLSEKPSNADVEEFLLKAAAGPAIVLLYGWVVKHFL